MLKVPRKYTCHGNGVHKFHFIYANRQVTHHSSDVNSISSPLQPKSSVFIISPLSYLILPTLSSSSGLSMESLSLLSHLYMFFTEQDDLLPLLQRKHSDSHEEIKWVNFAFLTMNQMNQLLLRLQLKTFLTNNSLVRTALQQQQGMSILGLH